MGLRCGSLSTTTPVSLLANEFDVQSVLRGQESLVAVNQIYVIHKAINSCKNLKIYIKACFENVNIKVWTIFTNFTLFAMTKTIFSERNTFLCGNYNLWPLRIYNGQSHPYCFICVRKSIRIQRVKGKTYQHKRSTKSKTEHKWASQVSVLHNSMISLLERVQHSQSLQRENQIKVDKTVTIYILAWIKTEFNPDFYFFSCQRWLLSSADNLCNQFWSRSGPIWIQSIKLTLKALSHYNVLSNVCWRMKNISSTLAYAEIQLKNRTKPLSELMQSVRETNIERMSNLWVAYSKLIPNVT